MVTMHTQKKYYCGSCPNRTQYYHEWAILATFCGKESISGTFWPIKMIQLSECVEFYEELKYLINF